jgi:hypothetical protein
LRLVCLSLFLVTAFGRDVSYWIDPRPGGDAELAEWALKAWERSSNGALHLVKAPNRNQALLRVVWASGRDGLYGEARPIKVNGQRGAELFVRPEMDGLGPEIAASAKRDPLLRDAIVYLTCLHESGHGLGLAHTARFADIMYSFGYGGDISEYFARYRRKLASRADIRGNSGISDEDQARLRTVLDSN